MHIALVTMGLWTLPQFFFLATALTSKTQRSGRDFVNLRLRTARLPTIYNRIWGEERSKQERGIRDRALVDLSTNFKTSNDKISERSVKQRFDDSMSSFSSEKRIKFDNLLYRARR